MLLQTRCTEAARRIGDADMATYPAVAPWREAYRAFGVKPAKQRSSIENLLRSAVAGTLRSINPLVDLYNTVSLRHLLPCGGEDLRAIAGDIRLTRAIGGEDFVPLGSAEPQPPQPGEVIYRDDVGIICRAWNWREAERTKLTEQTTDAFLCIEALPPTDIRIRGGVHRPRRVGHGTSWRYRHHRLPDHRAAGTAIMAQVQNCQLRGLQTCAHQCATREGSMCGAADRQYRRRAGGARPDASRSSAAHQRWGNDFALARNHRRASPR